MQLAAVGPALAAQPVLADEVLPAEAALVADLTLEPAPSQYGATVYLEQPVGTAFVGEADGAAGDARYAVRVGGAETGVVRFSSQRPRILPREIAGSEAGGVQVVGSAPAGLPLGGRLTSQFGNRMNPVSGVYQQHAGIDLAAATGSAVASTGAGVVRFSGPAGNYGLLVVIDHGGGVESRYAHLSQLMVARGQRVTRGQAVGLVGSTGRSTGPHLHYEVRTNGRALDPLRH